MIQEILRLRGLGLSKRMIARALNCSRNTVDKYFESDSAAAASAPPPKRYQASWSERIDWDAVRSFTGKGDPLRAFWEERVINVEGQDSIPFVSFWREYRRRFPQIPLDFHKNHPPGERCEIDYKGFDAGFGYLCPKTAEFVPCRLFGAVLCFSQLFFCRATISEKQEDLLRSVAESFSYFGGVPHTCAFDNTKAAVNRPHRYDPDIHKEFTLFCGHHGTAPLAMRPRQPKDKNLIENALGVFWRWARRHLRDRVFFSLGELNTAMVELADEFNNRIQRKYGVSRRQKFEEGERAKLLPQPLGSYSYGVWKEAKVHPDCHIQIEKNFYSVPYQLRGKSVEVRISGSIVEAYFELRCVSRHLRAGPNSMGKYITSNEHLPEAHLALLEATPQRALEDAAEIGPGTEAVVKLLLENSVHPLTYLRRIQGILRLAKRYSKAELDRVCSFLHSTGTQRPGLRDIEALIKRNRDQPLPAPPPVERQSNPYLRGQDFWRQP